MKEHKLIGRYTDTKIQNIKSDEKVCHYIPLLEEGDLLFGVKNLIKLMHDHGLYPTERSFDMLMLSLLVYLADTRISRYHHSDDSWTRYISIEIPVWDYESWEACEKDFGRMLQFLTGDIWQISFVQKDEKSCSEKSEEERSSAYEQVSLFSGGMDSLIYVLDSLESGREKMLLISHANDSTIKNKRTDVLKGVVDFYKDRSVITSVDLWTKFKGNCLESFDENSTRSRSFLFIALGLFVMSGTSNLKTLFVPENGFIAMNVPLEAVRVGSHSTRTTHPFYFDGWNKILASLGFDMAIENPYWAKTKGEMVQECKNKSLLKTLLDTAISCSSPSKSRWKGKSAQHCGYCYPCLIRRAALHSAGVIDSTRYLEESLSIMRDQRDGASSINLRSIEYQLSKLPKGVELTKAYILKTGPLLQNEEYLAQLAQVYQRGMQELHNFIRSF